MLSSSASSDASASRNCSHPRNSLFWLRSSSHRTHSSGRETPPTERTEHTEPSDREVPPTDWHGCAQIRRVWHPAVPTQPTAPTNFCEFREFRGRTAHHNNLCSSVPSVGVLSLQEGSVRSVHSVGGVAVVWCSRDCCTPWWCIRAICGRFSQQSASVSSTCSVGGQRSSNLL